MQTRGNPWDGNSGALVPSLLALGTPTPVLAAALTVNPGSASVLIINHDAAPLPAPVTIVTHPTDIIDCEDHVVSFKVVISGGTDPVTYTWQRMRPAEPGFSDIPAGAPNISYPAPGTLRIDNVGGFENPGGSRYRVVITDPSGSVTSNDAVLTVNEITDVLPSVALPAKTNVILCEGTGFSYTVTTSGTPPVAYQWKKYLGPGVWSDLSDNAVISGAQGPVLTFNHPTPAESGEYKVNLTFHASGADCNVSSDSRTRVVTFLPAPVAPVLADPGTACLGLPPPPLAATPASGGSGDFLYQWQESPDGVDWSDIPGATSLTFQPPLLTSAVWFRLMATDNGPVSCGNHASAPRLLPVTDCLSRHYRTIASGGWHDRTIWETSADGFTWGGTAWTHPTDQMLSTHIRPGHLVEVTQDVSTARVTVEPGGALTVEEGATLTNGDPNGASGFVVHSSETAHGSLIVNGAFNGNLTFRKYYDPTRWTIMASPLKVASGFMGNSAAFNFNTPTNDYDFAWYQELDNYGWSYFTSFPDALDAGKGYLVHPANKNAPDDGMVTFSGTLNGAVNDTVSPAVYCTSPRHGWNAVGNPFTSAIGVTAFASTAENFLTKNAAVLEDSYAAVYLWNQTGEYDGSQQYYKAIGNSGYNFEGFSYYGGSDPAYLQSGQGFLVNVKGTAKAIFSTAMQVHRPLVQLKASTIAGVDPPKESPAKGRNGWHGMTLVVRQGHRERQAVIAFHHSMTTGLDKTYDAGLFPSNDFRVYTRLVSGDSGANLEIQCLPEEMYDDLVVPIGLDLPQGGEVLMKTEGVILPDEWGPYLEDRQTGITINLKPVSSGYKVNFPAGTSGTGRFFLRFGKSETTAVDRRQEAVRSVCYADGKIMVYGCNHRGTSVELYDIQGRKLGNYLFPEDGPWQIPVSEFSNGIYVLHMVNDLGGQVIIISVANK